MLYVSQPARTAQIKKFKDALRLRLLGGRRRMIQRCRNASYRIRIRCSSTCRWGRWSAAAWMRIAALPRLSFNRLPAVFRGKGVLLQIIARDRDAPKRGTWIRIEMRAGATSPG